MIWKYMGGRHHQKYKDVKDVLDILIDAVMNDNE